MGDFGLSKNIQQSMAMSVVGTFGWMSPDHLNGNFSFKTDMWSLGCIIYYLISLDAALLLLPVLRFPDPDLCKKTVAQILEGLRHGSSDSDKSFLFRYIRKDDFGSPKSAFLLCSFWLVQALTRTGEQSLATEVMAQAVSASNELGLFSEHFIPAQKRQTGNYPQAYSHVGLINAAFSVSPAWSEIL